jgi:hypothetical protein
LIVWVKRVNGRYALKIREGPSYDADEVSIDGEPIGSAVREVHVEAVTVRLVAEQGKVHAVITTEPHLLAFELAEALENIPLKVTV